MRQVMTDEQRLFFEANGYLVIPEALDTEELARVRVAADRAEASWRADPSRLGGRGKNLEQVQAPIEYDVVLLELLAHPKVFPIVREILGDDVSMIDNDYFLTPPRTRTHAHWHHSRLAPLSHGFQAAPGGEPRGYARPRQDGLPRRDGVALQRPDLPRRPRQQQR